MADEPQDPPAEPQADASTTERVDRLESKLDNLISMLSGDGHPDPETQGAPNVAAEIRQQLEERDRAEKAAASDKAREDRLKAAETKLAELAEKPPGPLPRDIEKIMGWS
jgi:hypothetical protein